MTQLRGLAEDEPSWENLRKGLGRWTEVSPYKQALSHKLDSLAKVLRLHPYDSTEQFQGKLQPISHKSTQPALTICPDAMECQTLACKSLSLQQITSIRDIPYVTLIKGTIIYEGAKQNIRLIMIEQSKARKIHPTDST